MRWAIPFLLISLVGAQQPATDVDTMLRNARAEIQAFEKAGGKKDDPKHPVEKWVETLWALKVSKATSEAVRLLVRADRFSEAQARVDQLAPDDPAWEGLGQVLNESASRQKNYTYFFEKVDAVIPKAPDLKVRAALELSRGRAWRAQKDVAKARTSFEAAITTAPGSPAAKQAETDLYELLHLSPGQPAPQFSATAVDGAKISLADYRGKPVVLVFWATH